MRKVLALPLVAGILLAGCLAPLLDDDEVAPEPFEVSFGSIPVGPETIGLSGLAWLPEEGARTAIVLIHGFSGVKENYFDTLPEKGYSIGANLASMGYGAIAIDLPGYGKSGGVRMGGDAEVGYGIEAQAEAVDAVAQQLRTGSGSLPAFDHVVGLGISMGGLVVDAAQGLHGSFDAIIPISAPHSGLQSMFVACAAGSLQGCDDYESPNDDFVMSNADPDVVAAMIAGYENPHAVNLASIVAYAGVDCGDACMFTPQSQNSLSIGVPVLSILGAEDRIFNVKNTLHESLFYPNSPDAQERRLANTGHVATHHLNHQDVLGAIANWLVNQSL